MNPLKEKLNQVFDDNLHTKRWHNILDWTIISLIIISSFEIFLSTFSGISEEYGRILKFVDVFTTIFFTIEVSLRIWAADALTPKYSGFKGRIRYCLSFYGLIDILATYPSLFGLFSAVPITALKIFRIVRLTRIFRYMKSFRILGDAIASKKQELGISFAFLSILTAILSFFLYYAEHEAQPELCENAWSTLVWAFAKYLGDPGKIADFPLVTVWGNIIAAIVGALGIAIFAVPAGLIGSGFVEVIQERNHQQEISDNIETIRHAFRWIKEQQFTNCFHVPPFQAIDYLLVRSFITEDKVVEAVKVSPNLHLYNLAKAYNTADQINDRVVVVSCPHNRPYGVCIDRGSKVTIVSTSSSEEPITGWVAYHIAKIGGFNYVSKEVELDRNNPVSFYNITDENANDHLSMYLNDINRLSGKAGSWVIPMAFCTGPKTREHSVHLCYSPEKHDHGYANTGKTFLDSDTFERFSAEMATCLESKYGLKTDKNDYYIASKDNLLHHINCENGFALRIECKDIYFPENKIAVMKSIADIINHCFGTGEDCSFPEEMKHRPQDCFGYSGYND